MDYKLLLLENKTQVLLRRHVYDADSECYPVEIYAFFNGNNEEEEVFEYIDFPNKTTAHMFIKNFTIPDAMDWYKNQTDYKEI